jgi:hypothetical protein
VIGAASSGAAMAIIAGDSKLKALGHGSWRGAFFGIQHCSKSEDRVLTWVLVSDYVRSPIWPETPKLRNPEVSVSFGNSVLIWYS